MSLIPAVIPKTGFAGPFSLGADGTAGQLLKTDGARVLGWSSPYFVNVMDHGAVGNGVANDATAINAAITSLGVNGGTVFLPALTFKITSSILMKDNIRILGAKQGRRINGTLDWKGTVIDASSLSGTTRAFYLSSGNTNNLIYESFGLLGPTSPSGNVAKGEGTVGISLSDFVSKAIVRDVNIEGFHDGILIKDSNQIAIQDAYVSSAKHRGIAITGSGSVQILGGLSQNNGLSSLSDNGNISIGSLGGPATAGITIIQPSMDEAGHASLNIQDGTDITYCCNSFYFSGINSNGTGAGYGIKLGDGTFNPSRVKIIGPSIGPFGAHVCTNTILMYGSDHTLIGVTTNPNGGGDIADNSTGSRFFNVNGKTTFEVVATASLPAAAAAQNGRILIEDNGAGDRNLIFYSGGERFRIDGGANV